MITLYQESVPFTNKRLDQKISNDAIFTNPVIMPYAFDSTSGINTFETVIYIRNDDQTKYYNNVVVSLMNDTVFGTTGASGTVPVSGAISPNAGNVSLLLNNTQVKADIAYENYTYINIVNLNNKYMSTYLPISNDGNIEVKFSYGYDDLSSSNWEDKNSALIIPFIGNQSMSDMSYIPIRMRIKLLSEPSVFTLRNYFIDVSYETENNVTGA